ncbi:alpha/beta fold hydrolase [Lactiplantibacillus garii]|uniref:Alpha/beta fold hydrolase n=1 Tax=Lactiplantibacillus garii TaxID=2306423 RepID=A0A3R8KK62_9LACO|nr:alpha/beta fold hydrolase [Lactiplantibacillus garii]RRK11458.1 alpha/beta fold hydrolase [Lactiplantibacillus garii]
MIQTLNIVTKSGTELKGTLFKAPRATTVLVAITGVHGNFYSNPFYVNIGKTLMAAGIDFIYAQTRDAFSQVESLNHSTGQTELVGSWSESFDDADSDVAAYLAYTKAQRYQHVILGGHSLGANKVIHYLANHPRTNVDKFLLLSPANLKRLTDTVPLDARRYVQGLVKRGQGDQLLPFQLFGWLPCTADTAYQWLYSTTLDNVHSDKQADFSQVEQIKQSGALVIGTLDTFTYGDPKQYLQTINAHFRTSVANELVYIEGTGHTYQDKEQQLAREILKLLQGWLKGGS